MALVDSADVVSFTGSTAVGRAVVQAATGRGTPVQAEVGGQNAAIVLPDADVAANAVAHGLVSPVHTADLDAALRCADRLATGMVKINAPPPGVDFHLPFGGEKASSHGPRVQGKAALDFYTRTRTVTMLSAA